MCIRDSAAGAAARFFPNDRVSATADLVSLMAWQRELARVARHDEHPWNEGLLLDALVTAGAAALTRSGNAQGTGLDTLAR